MELKKNGILYKIAYGWKEEENRPKTASLCLFFWQVVLSIVVVWPLTIVLIIIDYAVIRTILGFLVVLPLFGYRPTWGLSDWEKNDRGYFDDDQVGAFRKIRTWPKIQGNRLNLGKILFWLVVILILLTLGSFFYVMVSNALSRLWVELIRPEPWLVGFVLAVGVGIAVGIILSVVKKFEWWRLLTAFIKAKKERVCPQITFN